MKIKKQLQKSNEEINKKILENGNDLYNTLITENNFDSQTIFKSNNNKKLVLVFSLSSVFIFVIALSIILSFALTNTNKDIQYVDGNNRTIESNLEEINNADSKVSINSERFTYSCYKTYDEASGDTLYYHVTLIHNSDLLEGQISIVENTRYTFDEHYTNEKTTDTYKGYKITYSVELDESDMLPMNKFFGCLEIGDTKVYFKFSGVAFVHATPNLFLDEALIIQ